MFSPISKALDFIEDGLFTQLLKLSLHMVLYKKLIVCCPYSSPMKIVCAAYHYPASWGQYARSLSSPSEILSHLSGRGDPCCPTYRCLYPWLKYFFTEQNLCEVLLWSILIFQHRTYGKFYIEKR
jgi:hypothetical protein